MAFIEDLSVFTRDFYSLAEFAGSIVQVIFDRTDEDILNGVGQSSVYTMEYVATDLPLLGHGNSIVIDGENYQVHSISKVPPDGAFKTARLFAV